jgi:hypothetical protein
MVCPFMMLFSPAGSLARHVPTAIKSWYHYLPYIAVS